MQENAITGELKASSGLTSKQERALAALLVSPTIEVAAQQASVNPATLYRWLKEPLFVSAFRASRREIVSLAIVQLQRASGFAVKTLLDISTDPTASAGARVSAARTILEMSIKAVELDDLTSRIEHLESVAKGAVNAN